MKEMSQIFGAGMTAPPIVHARFSIGDVVKHKIDQLTFERDQLDSYVHQA